MTTVIAWNGATGMIGKAALRFLVERCAATPMPLGAAEESAVLEIRLIGRSEDRLTALADELRADYPTVEWKIFPGCLSDTEHSPRDWAGNPVEGADIFINTAGPGYQLVPILVHYAAQMGVAYVDPAGDPEILTIVQQRLADDNTPVTAPIILGAGIQPGLSGILVRLLAQKAGPGGEVDIFCGGAQPTTRAAVQEFAQSVTAGFRWAGKQWTRGEIVPTTQTEEYRAQVASTFSATATAHAHCDHEVARAAEGTGVETVRWNNISDAPKTAVQIQKYVSGLASLDEVMTAAEYDNFGRRHYFRMQGTATTAEGDHWAARLDCTDSFLVTSSVTAQAAYSIIRPVLTGGNDPAPISAAGFYLPCDLPCGEEWWYGVMNDAATAYVPPITPVQEDADLLDDEEGEL